jgi:hypothetical protein
VKAADPYAQAADEHRGAVDACAAAIRSVAGADWERARDPRKWTPAQIAEHLAVSYDPLISELDGGSGFRIVVPWWKRRILRWKFLAPILAGTFPSGVPAPREVRPATTAPSPEEGARKLKDRAGVFLDRLERARQSGRASLTHPYMGRLSEVEALRFLTSHAHHHCRQLPGKPTAAG